MAEEKTPLKWKFKTGDSVFSSPAVSDDVVYFGSYDNYLYALDAKTGEEKWKFELNSIEPSDSPTISDGVVYFGRNCGYLYALGAKTGEEKWKFETEDYITSSPVVSEGIVYFGAGGTGGDSYLYALNIELKIKQIQLVNDGLQKEKEM